MRRPQRRYERRMISTKETVPAGIDRGGRRREPRPIVVLSGYTESTVAQLMLRSQKVSFKEKAPCSKIAKMPWSAGVACTR